MVNATLSLPANIENQYCCISRLHSFNNTTFYIFKVSFIKWDDSGSPNKLEILFSVDFSRRRVFRGGRYGGRSLSAMGF